ncbi:MAG: hypothetical protein ACRELG_26815 [Gemmataceae bacterium]
MIRLHACRIALLGLSALMLVPVSAGCAKKKKAAATTAKAPEAARNPLNVQPGGAPAQGVVRRGAQRQVNQQLLRNIGQYYVLYRTENGRSPRNLQEFLTYLKSDPNARTAKVPQVLESGWVVMVFSPEPASNQVLAYEKEAFQQFQNRVVLFGDGSVKLMDEPKFQAALMQGR